MTLPQVRNALHKGKTPRPAAMPRIAFADADAAAAYIAAYRARKVAEPVEPED